VEALSRRGTAALAACWFGAALLCAQQGDAPAKPKPPPDPLTVIAAAEKALADGPQEAVLLQLQGVVQTLRAAPQTVAQQAALNAATSLLGKADAAAPERAAAGAAAAKKLLEIERQYRSRSWFATAAAVCETAAEFDAAAAQKELQALQKQQPGLAPAKPAADKENTFEDLGRGDTHGDWRVREGALWSPAPPPADSASYLTKTRTADNRIRVDIDTGNCDALSGLILGAKDLWDHFILDTEVWRDSGNVAVRLYSWCDGKLDKLGEGLVESPKPRTRPLQVEVLVRGDTVRVSADGRPALTVRCGRPAHGLLGFYVSAASSKKDAIVYRSVAIRPLPAEDKADAAADKDAVQRDDALAAVAAAEAMLKNKQPEGAAEQLRAARRSTAALGAGTLRDELRASIDKLLAQADPLHGKRGKAFAEAAQALRPLADRYAELGWLQAASAVAASMARLDPDGQEATAAAFAQRAAAAQQAQQQAALAQRDGPPVDNAPLVEWFTNGLRPFAEADAFWQLGADGACSPELTGTQAYLIANRGDASAAAASVQFLLAENAFAGLVFGWRGPSDFGVAIAQWRDGKLQLGMKYWNGAAWIELGAQTFEVAADKRTGWIDLAVRYGPEGVVATCLGNKLESARADSKVNGRFGLLAGARGAQPQSVRFRAFVPPVATVPVLTPRKNK
jgi:hypothetical protein